MSVVETYKVQFVNGPLADVQRWSLDGVPQFLMGGTILDVADWEHLRKDFAVTHVINLETEHSDVGKVPAVVLFESPTPDNGEMKPAEWFQGIGRFASGNLITADAARASAKIYIHCQVGGSRTPMVVYYLLRRFTNLTPAGALTLIQTVKPSFGSAPYHVNYIASAEQALALR